jgi:hypothetical protein
MTSYDHGPHGKDDGVRRPPVVQSKRPNIIMQDFPRAEEKLNLPLQDEAAAADRHYASHTAEFTYGTNKKRMKRVSVLTLPNYVEISGLGELVLERECWEIDRKHTEDPRIVNVRFSSADYFWRADLLSGHFLLKAIPRLNNRVVCMARFEDAYDLIEERLTEGQAAAQRLLAFKAAHPDLRAYLREEWSLFKANAQKARDEAKRRHVEELHRQAVEEADARQTAEAKKRKYIMDECNEFVAKIRRKFDHTVTASHVCGLFYPD